MENENPITTETSQTSTTIEQPVTPPAEVKAAPASKTFTQEDLDRIVAERLSQDRARRGKEQVTKPAQVAPAVVAEKPVSAMSATEIRQMMARDREFTRVTASAGLSEKQVARMEAALVAENPESVTEWSRAYIEDLGLAKSPAAPAATVTHTAPTATAIPATPPAVAPSAPSGHGLPTQQGVIDVFSLSAAQLKELGPGGVREQLEKLTQIQRQQSGIPERRKPPSQR